MPLFSIIEHKRWCDLSYEEAKDLAIEAKAFRERKDFALGRFPGYLQCFLDVLVLLFCAAKICGPGAVRTLSPGKLSISERDATIYLV